MTAIFEENFEVYGTDESRLLEGIWAETGGNVGLSVPAWEEESRVWGALTGSSYTVRAVLAAAATSMGVFQIFRFSELPVDNSIAISNIRNGSNATILSLRCSPIGHIEAYNSAGTLLGSTSIPPIVAGSSLKIQYQAVFNAGAGTLEVRVGTVGSGALTTVLNLTGLTMAGTAAQVGFTKGSTANSRTLWVKAMAAYSLAGTYNNSWPAITDVVTILPDADTAVDNMTARPRKIFGSGIAQITASEGYFSTPTAAILQLAAGSFTFETWAHFKGLPVSTESFFIGGQWRQSDNDRSYQLVLNGASVNGGGLQWQVTTDGTTGTLTTVHDINWTPEIGHNYHIAVCRDGSTSRLFIDGVQQGVDVTDSATYFTPTNEFSLMCERDAGNLGIAATLTNGFLDEFRLTKGVARYTANFAVPTAEFPRSIGAGDADFASVSLLLGWDGDLIDDSSNANVISTRGASFFTVTDGVSNYQVVDNLDPVDDAYLEAALISATGILTMSGLPLDTETITVGATAYTWKTALSAGPTVANEILIGADVAASLVNLQDALNAGDGIGVRYSTGTTANASATGAAATPTATQLKASAIIPGTAGNSIASTETMTSSAWGASTFAGGLNLPGATEFGIGNLPATATGVRWVGLRSRSFISGGSGNLTASIDVNAAEADGASRAMTTSPVFYVDRFEEDPDTSSALTPSSIVNMKYKIERTA